MNARTNQADSKSEPKADAAPTPEAAKPATTEPEAGVKLRRGEGDEAETVTAVKPATVQRLINDGWTVVDGGKKGDAK